MSKKGENIYKRKDGRWEARYIKGYEFSGKAKYGFCYGKTYAEARQKLMLCKTTEFSVDKDPGFQQIPPPSRWFSLFCREWLDLQQSRVKDSTYVKYKGILEKHIYPALGLLYPESVDTRAAERFRKQLLDNGLSSKTVRDILTVFHAILKYAQRTYPGIFRDVEIAYPHNARQEARTLSVPEQQRFIVCLLTDMDYCKLGILLALLTGIRVGELCALRWKDISLENKTIRICFTMQRLQVTEPGEKSKTKIHIGSPKSIASCRTIPISDNIEILCQKMRPDDLDAYVLTGTEKYMEPRTVQYRMKKYTKLCGLEGVHCHTLRHTFATRSVELGVELKGLSEILGHSSPTETINRYVHSSMETKKTYMEKISVAMMER